jgi:hypothetical protein
MVCQEIKLRHTSYNNPRLNGQTGTDNFTVEGKSAKTPEFE